MSLPPLSMSPVASALANITGSCSCGTTTVVTSRTRSVHAASAPRRVIASGLSNAIRSPQHSDENGPSSMARAHVSRTGPSRSGSITGIVIPTCTTAIVARRRRGARRRSVARLAQQFRRRGSDLVEVPRSRDGCHVVGDLSRRMKFGYIGIDERPPASRPAPAGTPPPSHSRECRRCARPSCARRRSRSRSSPPARPRFRL